MNEDKEGIRKDLTKAHTNLTEALFKTGDDDLIDTLSRLIKTVEQTITLIK